jgi:hypothetical protein
MKYYVCRVASVLTIVSVPREHPREPALLSQIRDFGNPTHNADSLPSTLENCRIDGAWPEPVIVQLSKWANFPQTGAASLVQAIFRTAFRNGRDLVRTTVPITLPTPTGGTATVNFTTAVGSVPPRMVADDNLRNGVPDYAHRTFMIWALHYVVPAWGGTQPPTIPDFPDLGAARAHFTANP